MLNKKVCSIAEFLMVGNTDFVDNIDDYLCDNLLPQSPLELSTEENSS